MAEAEVVITIGIGEGLQPELQDNHERKQIIEPACFNVVASTPLLFHTLFNLYHWGLTKFTFIAPRDLREQVDAFI